jgi:hypothetical protein
MSFYFLLLGALVVWRLTHLVVEEDGPWDFLVRVRARIGHGFWGSLVDCFHCTSLWVAAPFAYLFGDGWWERLLLWPALSGAAILLERATTRSPEPPVALYSEDEEVSEDGLLR